MSHPGSLGGRDGPCQPYSVTGRVCEGLCPGIRWSRWTKAAHANRAGSLGKGARGAWAGKNNYTFVLCRPAADPTEHPVNTDSARYRCCLTLQRTEQKFKLLTASERTGQDLCPRLASKTVLLPSAPGGRG